MVIVRETGHALFGGNCAPCHGIDAKGGPGFPILTTFRAAVGQQG